MSRRILVVDDDRAMMRTLCDILTMRGWEARGVHSGEEALRAGTGESYEAVVMDVIMPGIDGIATYHALREQQPDLSIVLMTAHPTPRTIQNARAEGVPFVLTKPFDPGCLIALLGPPEQASAKH